jgi:hypothetical protein
MCGEMLASDCSSQPSAPLQNQTPGDHRSTPLPSPSKPRSFKTLDPSLSPDQRRTRQSDLLREISAAAASMSRALGPSHLLVAGLGRYQAQLAAAAGA